MGVLMFEFLVGEAPFEDTFVMTTRRIAREGMEIPSFASADVRDLIQKVSVLAVSSHWLVEQHQTGCLLLIPTEGYPSIRFSNTLGSSSIARRTRNLRTL